MKPTPGNSYARALLGVMGVALVLGGIAAPFVIVLIWPYAFFAASSGVAMIGYGANLLFGCAFYDEVEIKAGPLGFPIASRRSPTAPK
jgi:hypothetical protein